MNEDFWSDYKFLTNKKFLDKLSLDENIDDERKLVFIIMKGWAELERLIFQIVSHNFPEYEGSSVLDQILILRAKGLISESEYAVLLMLRNIRHRLAHGQSSDLDKESSKKYLDSIYNISFRLADLIDKDRLKG
ncbi:hypothetical protein ACUY1T_11495 [Billgrantia sp. Q4P2]|uniref:hypothetical protein n=1 Tax=Billgrantia sp. Q4P2 TaxID=3463857 RepID=UPI004055ADB1